MKTDRVVKMDMKNFTSVLGTIGGTTPKILIFQRGSPTILISMNRMCTSVRIAKYE